VPNVRGVGLVRSRRGFTILEVALASVIGVVIVGVCAVMLTTLERTDRLLEVRASQSGEMQRIHRVMQRMAGSLLLSGDAAASRRRTTTATATVVSVIDAATEPGAEAGAPKPPPRFILMQDPALAGVMMSRRVSKGPVAAMMPQRLEVVLTDPPVPSPSRTIEILERARPGITADDLDKQLESEDPDSAQVGAPDRSGFGDTFDEDLSEAPLRATRGALVFVLADGTREQRRFVAIREQGETPGSGELSSAPLFDLWWVQLPPRPPEGWEPGIERAYGPGPDSYRIASDIRFARWQVFSKRERKTQVMVTSENEIPAFIELEIEMGSGLWSNWMFEVPMPARGAEAVPTSGPEGTGERGSGGAGAASRSGAGGGTGGAAAETSGGKEGSK
jgi:hypothetical protein